MTPLIFAVLLGAGQTLPPIVTPAAGSYTGAQTITVKPRTGGSITRCTTDGTDPDITSSRQKTAIPVITLLTSATVRCRSWSPRRRPSEIVAQTYTIADGFAVSPAVATVAPGEVVTFTTIPFQATASWSATTGSITSAGVFTAPGCNSTASDIVIVATVNSAPATAGLLLQDKVTAITISPPTATLGPGETQQFISTVKTVCSPNGVQSLLTMHRPWDGGEPVAAIVPGF